MARAGAAGGRFLPELEGLPQEEVLPLRRLAAAREKILGSVRSAADATLESYRCL